MNHDYQVQAEIIADNYEKIANSYSPLKDSDVELPEIPVDSIPKISH